MAIKFSKTRILAMDKFYNRKDLLSVILSDSTEYSVSEVQKLLNKTLKGE